MKLVKYTSSTATTNGTEYTGIGTVTGRVRERTERGCCTGNTHFHKIEKQTVHHYSRRGPWAALLGLLAINWGGGFSRLFRAQMNSRGKKSRMENLTIWHWSASTERCWLAGWQWRTQTEQRKQRHSLTQRHHTATNTLPDTEVHVSRGSSSCALLALWQHHNVGISWSTSLLRRRLSAITTCTPKQFDHVAYK